MSNWHQQLSDLEAILVDDFQSGFPVEQRPYRCIANRLGYDETTVHETVCDLFEAGIFRRIGPVLNPPVIGSSALVAMRIPESELETAAETVNQFPEVNHNYERDHEWNMWFVVTADSRARRTALLDEIESATGYEVLALPMRTQYYISLEFPVANEAKLAESTDAEALEPIRIDEEPADLTGIERRLVLEIQDGFGLSSTPYRDLAETLDVEVSDVLAAIESLSRQNAIKRIGFVVNHHVVGFDANCMVVWDVPAEGRDQAGIAAGSHPSVTYCCHRVRRESRGWPYTLFTMIHGRSAEAVEETIDELAAERLPYEHQRLPTRAALKQTGARYRELVHTDDVGERVRS